MDSVELWFSDSSSDSEESILLNLRRQRRRIRDASNPLEMESKLFIKNFRLNKQAFVDILNKLNESLNVGISQSGIPNILKFAITLRFLAQGSYQLGVGNERMYGCAQPTVSVVLEEVLTALENNLCPLYINVNYTDEQKDASNLHFFNVCGIAGVIGAMDGTHIKVIAPAKRVRHLYYNRKGFYSINAMLVCDNNMVIRYIDAKHPGSSQESAVFNMSDLKLHLETRYRNGMRNTWLLGDAGYALQPYLLTPYRSPEEGSIESNFNTHHCKGRNIIERTIGVFKNQWRCILGARALHYTPQKATKIINVCAALHNICRQYNVPLQDITEDNSIQESIEEANNQIFDPQSSEAEAIRADIARTLFNCFFFVK